MMWRDIRGSEAALQFDLHLTRLQAALLSKSAQYPDIRDLVIGDVSELPITITQVAERIDSIKKAKSLPFYKTASVDDLETLRGELRGVMRHRRKPATSALGPLILNVREDANGFRLTPHKPKLEGLDLAHYRTRVEGVLKFLMEESDALKKIRAGVPVAPADLQTLISDVLLQDPDLHLDDLLIHFPNKASRIDLAIRQVIGLDAAKVDEKFRAFVQKYPALNANQLRFLDLLKSYIARYGAIELEKLWEAPFTSVHGSGVDGVFTNSQQVDDLLALLCEINEVAA
jgi:type I restriction enzyme R subunit